MLSPQLVTVFVKFNRTSKHWNRVQFTNFFKKKRHPIREVAVGRFYRTALDVDDGFEDRTLVSREYTSLRADSDSRIFAAIKQRTIIGPVLQVHTRKCLGMYGIET